MKEKEVSRSTDNCTICLERTANVLNFLPSALSTVVRISSAFVVSKNGLEYISGNIETQQLSSLQGNISAT